MLALRERDGRAPDVELRAVTKRFGDHLAVDDVSIVIQPGEFFSLLGPSGCGKSTTLRLIAGFERPSQGDVFIRGRRVNDVPPYRRETNLVFQQLALFPHLNVFENIAYGLRIKGMSSRETRERVGRMLELVDLVGFEGRPIRGLSGGQQQRVAIARALVNEPAVLLLDEPLGSLDLKLRAQMQLELKSLQHRLHTTFVYVTHDQGEALTMSDRIAVMNHGRLEQLGTSEEIYARPRTEFVATFIGETNLIPVEVDRRAGERWHVTAGPLRFEMLAMGATRPRVVLSLRPERIRIGDSVAGCDVVFTGRVHEVIHSGAVIRYQLLVGDRSLTVHAQNDRDQHYRAGEDVRIGWRVQDTIVVGQEPGLSQASEAIQAVP
jgi:ABC-type Fe3+/spermidine/putrescine transport system ATPase subunit